jgi:UDP-glucuronate 4-epimerase
MQAGDVLATAADIEDTRKDLGWEPRTGIQEGLRLFTKWFKEYYKT